MGDHIVVIDYGMGNLRSVARALEQVGENCRVQISDDPKTIASADRVVFPGQGAARDCMRHITDRGLVDSIRQAFNSKPFFGICMGLQVLFERSAENGGTDCLGFIPGQVVRFQRQAASADGKIPHMGWNRVAQQKTHAIWQAVPDRGRFYFVHSYYVQPEDSGWVAANTDYLQPFVSAVSHENIFATQFHPEKSAQTGLAMLKNFVSWKI